MCQMASFIFHPRTLEVKTFDLTSHSETYDHFVLADTPGPDGWREGHYLQDGTIECRVLDVDRHSAAECCESVRKRWPTFVAFFNAHCPERVDGLLDLSELTSAKGLTPPESPATG